MHVTVSTSFVPSSGWRPRSAGFTMIELAVALVVIAILLGSILVPLNTQVETRKYDETQRVLERAREALIGYAAATGRFPCPASSTSNGAEAFFTPGGSATNGLCHSSVTTAATSVYAGFLPAATLGITPVDNNGYAVDSWPQWSIGGVPQNRIRYAVSFQSVNSTSNCTATPVTLPFTKLSGMRNASMSCVVGTSLLNVCNTAAGSTPTSCAAGATLTSNAIVVIWSLGPNAATSGGVSAEEAKNSQAFTSTDRVFVSKIKSGGPGDANEFDDLVTWISPPLLFNRMIAAGQLP